MYALRKHNAFTYRFS
uniref:Uncharacterized protein n=1 Tax=Arundo donax TaxID=35708 RepID=A0A0A9ESA3_ARUDO